MGKRGDKMALFKRIFVSERGWLKRAVNGIYITILGCVIVVSWICHIVC